MKTKIAQTDITSQLDRLIDLLEKQLDCVRKSRLDSFEKLSSQTESLIESLNRRQHLLKASKHSRKLAKIRELYDMVSLATTSQTQDLSNRLEHIRQGRKTLSKYQDFAEKSV